MKLDPICWSADFRSKTIRLPAITASAPSQYKLGAVSRLYQQQRTD